MLETFQHQLQRFDPGIVWLDAHNRVIGLNTVALQVLGADAETIIGQEILHFHPERSRAKVQLLLESSACPADSPPPMTMMINIPDKILLIKVSKIWGHGVGVGTCMVFYDLTELTSAPRQGQDNAGKPRLLFKLPVQKLNRVMLVDLDEVVCLKAEGHYTTVFTCTEQYLCNLSLSELEARLLPGKYLRVHRSYMINIRFAKSFEKEDEQYSILMAMPGELAVPVSRSKVKEIKIVLGLD